MSKGAAGLNSEMEASLPESSQHDAHHKNVKGIRSAEENYVHVLARKDTGSGSVYQCRLCHKQFCGGPKKIRVHFIGSAHNGTRVLPCPQASKELQEVMLELETKSKTKGKNTASVSVSVSVDANSDRSSCDSTPSGPMVPRNAEESYVEVLSRKNCNSHYRCLLCHMEFTGGPQKIRVHLTGESEGGTRVAKCPNAYPQIQEDIRLLRFCSKRGRKRDRAEITPSSSADDGTHASSLANAFTNDENDLHGQAFDDTLLLLEAPIENP